MKTALTIVVLSSLASYAQTQLTVGDFDYVINPDGTSVTIVDYEGGPGALYIPASIDGLTVTSIGFAAFADYGLTNITVPGSVTNIAMWAFNDNAYLQGIYFEGFGNAPSVSPPICAYDLGPTVYFFPYGTGWGTFAAQTGLSLVQLGQTYPYLPIFPQLSYDLAGDNTATLTQYIGPSVNLSIPTNIAGALVTAIGVSAFNEDLYSPPITNLIVPDSVLNFEDYALAGCYSLQSIVIGAGVTNLGHDPFSECINLSSITVSPQNSIFSSIDGVLFDKNQSTLISYPPSKYPMAFGVPATVTNIAPSAFQFYGQSVGMIFLGNAPAYAPASFGNFGAAYYLAGATGWPSFSTNTGIPCLLWNPATAAASLGGANRSFAFTINGTASIPLVVQAATNLINPTWTTVESLSLTNGLCNFSDPQWTNFGSRYYRIAFP